MDGKQSLSNKTGYSFKHEVFTWELYEEVKPLLKEHWEEVADDKDNIKLDPNKDYYFLMEESKSLHCLVCRDIKGKIKGYVVTFIINHPHYKNNKFASIDILYLHPKNRKGMLGIKLIKKHEEMMKELNVDIIAYHFKPKKDFSNILERLGHSFFEISYRKYIGE